MTNGRFDKARRSPKAGPRDSNPTNFVLNNLNLNDRRR